jgi:hypothetical protein
LDDFACEQGHRQAANETATVTVTVAVADSSRRRQRQRHGVRYTHARFEGGESLLLVRDLSHPRHLFEVQRMM